jgi:hypothetical protein
MCRRTPWRPSRQPPIEKGELAVRLEIEVAGELVLSCVKVHLACPSNKTLTGHRKKLQVASRSCNGRLDGVDELGEFVREPLDAEGVLVDAEEELDAPNLP